MARTDDFVQFCKDVAMHITAFAPQYVSVEDVPNDEGLSDKQKQDIALLEQKFAKDSSVTVGQHLQTLIGKTGENVVVRRFSRFTVGEGN